VRLALRPSIGAGAERGGGARGELKCPRRRRSAPRRTHAIARGKGGEPREQGGWRRERGGREEGEKWGGRGGWGVLK
jgi:hypothetical protein